MRIKSSNLRTQSFDPEDEAPLPAGAPLPPVLKRGVSRLSDLQARERGLKPAIADSSFLLHIRIVDAVKFARSLREARDRNLRHRDR